MKKRKKQIANLLKLGVFLFGFSLLLWNCEDDKTEGLTEVELYKQASLVNTKLVSQKLGLGENNIFIRWDKPTILVLDKKNQGGVYQYDIEQKEPVSNNSNLFVDKLTLKLIVREKEGVVEDVQIYRYEPFKESLNTAPSEIAKEGFSGMKFIFNELAELEDIYTYKLGKKISSFNETKSDRIDKHKNILYPKMDDSEFDSCLDLNGKPLKGCNGGGGSGSGSGGGYVTETTRHYTDWYNRCDSCSSNDGKIYNYGGINYIYVHTKYNGSTTRWVWVSSGGDRYVDVYNSNSPSGGGPAYDGEDREYSSGGGNNGYELPCPIGFEKVGDNCVKIVESYDDDIIDDTNNPCVGDIIKELQKKDTYGALVPDLKGKGHLSEMVLDLFGKCKNYDLVIDVAQLGTNSQGFPKNAETNGIESITLDTDLVKDATKLSIAKTLIHESLHVYINFKTYQDREPSLAILLNKYYQKYRVSYPDDVANNLTQHQFISQYVEAMAYSLSAYDNHQQSMDYYTAMSWGGLESSDTYKALSSTEKTAIQKIIKNERYAKSDAKSTKCK
ncbi:hypothetical protein Q4517_07180 [Tenacibaculum sp. 1_MG-2023]|uniref:hypothetical protein n=1 Tax=Tenacibaculum sp. 1_MG-2023 TaxID=3062653 RepID=UPI0026E40564|nr:hypothetical protein [Tenacibaculum sp. 1_MG-2023]MDO6675330.1 hypothetical protein [Tenacibaculum sp. 1_MG-2023]